MSASACSKSNRSSDSSSELALDLTSDVLNGAFLGLGLWKNRILGQESTRYAMTQDEGKENVRRREAGSGKRRDEFDVDISCDG